MLLLAASLGFKPTTQVRIIPVMSPPTCTVSHRQTDNEEQISIDDWLEILIQPLTVSADRRSASGTPAIHLPAAGINASSDTASWCLRLAVVPLDATVSAGFAPGSWTPPATPAWSPPVGSSAEPSQQPQRQDPYPGCLFTNPPYQPLLGQSHFRFSNRLIFDGV